MVRRHPGALDEIALEQFCHTVVHSIFASADPRAIHKHELTRHFELGSSAIKCRNKGPFVQHHHERNIVVLYIPHE
jgi:hypothetical protein